MGVLMRVRTDPGGTSVDRSAGVVDRRVAIATQAMTIGVLLAGWTPFALLPRFILGGQLLAHGTLVCFEASACVLCSRPEASASGVPHWLLAPLADCWRPSLTVGARHSLALPVGV